MVNFGLLAAEIVLLVWGTPANFNRFRVLAALLHSTLVVASAKLCGVEQRAPPIFGRAAITLALAHILVFDVFPKSRAAQYWCHFVALFELCCSVKLVVTLKRPVRTLDA